MDQMQQIEAFTELLLKGIEEAMPLMNEDPERARSTLQAILYDIAELTDLWTNFIIRNPS